MNGYISPSTGCTHPPIFRSPIKYTEDILANEVISCIYRLPKAQKHITRPLAAVIFPPKIVQFSDLKTEPVLWHEDSGRRAWENGRSHVQVLHLMERHNTPGAISGRRLVEASHRFIANSLQMKVDCNGFNNDMQAPPPSYAAAPCVPPVNSHVNYGFHNQGQHIMAPPGLDYFSAGYPISQTSPLRPHLAHGYNEPYGSPHQYQINNQAAANNFHYPLRDHQNGGSRHMPRPTTQLSMEIGLYPSRPGGYDGNRMYQAPGTGSHQEWCGGMGPQANQNVSGGYGLHQQGGVNRGLHSGHDHQQQRGNQMHNQRGGYHQRGSQLRRGNQQHGGIQQQRGNSYVALDRQRHRRPLAPPVENSH
ncbi:5'-3' exoribonuclease 3-like protein [Theobroma cacao]|uniref:5'-3' exoribonuclease 3-like protein n=1 Tax=Theobroma cacao TaxID=3641 RepID=A0A061FB57_THECC|nr:5'-3' exoribonuclease 3-like protein [Theobroma cacao]